MDPTGATLGDRIGSGEPLLLDGATGTELEHRGVPTPVPLWSADAIRRRPDVLLAIHGDYAGAGVDALTANTFRTQRRALAGGGLGRHARALTDIAVRIARRAASKGSRGPLFVLGSAPTLEDCYRPDRVPDDDALAREHGEHARHLAEAGVDGILVETLNTVRETVAATRAARATGAPTLASFVCWEGARLLSGEPLADAATAAADAGAIALLVNCLPPSNVHACLEVLATSGLPFGAYPNLGEPEDEQGFARSEDCSPDAFADEAADWVAVGARIVGGCCGTTPDHLRAVAQRLKQSPSG